MMSTRPEFSAQSPEQDLRSGLMPSLFIPTVLFRLPDIIYYKREFSESRYWLFRRRDCNVAAHGAANIKDIYVRYEEHNCKVCISLLVFQSCFRPNVNCTLDIRASG